MAALLMSDSKSFEALNCFDCCVGRILLSLLRNNNKV